MLAPIEEIFCDMDDFCKQVMKSYGNRLLPNPHRQRERQGQMYTSEIMTIQILFHLSHYRTFKDFYLNAYRYLKAYFPRLLSYTRFVEVQGRTLFLLAAYLRSKAGSQTGLYYVDSTPLKGCHVRRIYRHKVFRGIAQRGKSSMGWFFGFKLHLVVNQKGELISFSLSRGNVDDRQPLERLMKGLKGLAAGDKGYLSQSKADRLLQQGLRFITRVRSNMKEKTLSAFEAFFLNHRGLVETVIDQLKSICQIEHTRHRSPFNFLSNILAGLAAYVLRPRKPKLFFQNFLLLKMLFLYRIEVKIKR